MGTARLKICLKVYIYKIILFIAQLVVKINSFAKPSSEKSWSAESGVLRIDMGNIIFPLLDIVMASALTAVSSWFLPPV